jgi:hypothetical protein
MTPGIVSTLLRLFVLEAGRGNRAILHNVWKTLCNLSSEYDTSSVENTGPRNSCITIRSQFAALSMKRQVIYIHQMAVVKQQLST